MTEPDKDKIRGEVVPLFYVENGYRVYLLGLDGPTLTGLMRHLLKNPAAVTESGEYPEWWVNVRNMCAAKMWIFEELCDGISVDDWLGPGPGPRPISSASA